MTAKPRSAAWELRRMVGRINGVRVAYGKPIRAVACDGLPIGRPDPIQLSPALSICSGIISSALPGRWTVSATLDAMDAGKSSRAASLKNSRCEPPAASSTTS